MRGSSHALARRYARALLEVVVEKGADPGALREELLRADRLLLGSPELARVLLHPAVSAERKKKVLAALWEKARPSPLLARLVDVLADRDRLALLPLIAAAYTERWNERRGVMAAEAVSAAGLTATQQDALLGALKRLSGQGVELAARVEPEALGGLLVHMGGKTYDGTVRGRLRALRDRLVEGR